MKFLRMTMVAFLFSLSAGAQPALPTIELTMLPAKPLRSRLTGAAWDNSPVKINAVAETISLRVEFDGSRVLAVNIPNSVRDVQIVDSNAEDATRATNLLFYLIEEKMVSKLALGTVQDFLIDLRKVNSKTVVATIQGREVQVSSFYSTLKTNPKGEMLLSPEFFRRSLNCKSLSDQEIAQCLQRPTFRDQIELCLNFENTRN